MQTSSDCTKPLGAEPHPVPGRSGGNRKAALCRGPWVLTNTTGPAKVFGLDHIAVTPGSLWRRHMSHAYMFLLIRCAPALLWCARLICLLSLQRHKSAAPACCQLNFQLRAPSPTNPSAPPRDPFCLSAAKASTTALPAIRIRVDLFENSH